MMSRNNVKANFRIWHWLNAVAIFGLLATTLLRKTFLSYKTNSLVIKEKLSEINIDITVEQAKVIAKAIRVPMWEWHYIFGFMLVALMVYRIYIAFSDSEYKLFDKNSLKFEKNAIVDLTHSFIYLFITIMSITGLILYFKLGLSKEILHSFKEFHELLMFAFAFFVPLHIVGVIFADIKEEKGVISKMVNGEKSG